MQLSFLFNVGVGLNVRAADCVGRCGSNLVSVKERAGVACESAASLRTGLPEEAKLENAYLLPSPSPNHLLRSVLWVKWKRDGIFVSFYCWC